MGPDVDPLVGIDLSTQNYLDLRFWKRVLATELLPSGINVTDSNSTSVGWIVVYNDVRTDVQALVQNATVTAASLRVEAHVTALHPLDRRRQRRLLGRQLAEQRRHVAGARLRDRDQRDPLERARRDRRRVDR